MFNLTHRNRYLYPVEGFGGLVDVQSEYEVEAAGGVGDNDKIASALLAATAGNLTLYFGDGEYLISSKMVVANCAVVCSPHAVFKPSAVDIDMLEMRPISYWDGGYFYTRHLNYTGTVIQVDGDYVPSSAYNAKAPKMSNIDIYGNGAGGKGLYIFADHSTTKYVTFMITRNIRIFGYTNGLHLYAADKGYVNNCVFDNFIFNYCDYPLHLEAAAGASYSCNGNRFSNFSIQCSAAKAVDAVKLTGCDYNAMFLSIVDAQNLSGYAVNLDNSNYNTILGAQPGLTHYDNGVGNIISGYNNKSWSGADLGQSISVTYDPTPMSDATSYTSDAFDFPGLELGDMLLVGNPQGVLASLYQAHVTAADTFKISVRNETGDAIASMATTEWTILRVPKRRRSVAVTVDPGVIAAGDQEEIPITVPGAVITDFVVVGPGVDISGFYCSATVTTDETVTVVLHNFTAGEINLDSSTWSVLLIDGKTYTSIATLDFASLDSGNGATKTITETGNFTRGQIVLWSPCVDVLTMLCCPSIATSNTLFARIENFSGDDALNLPPTTMRFKVIDPTNDGLIWLR